MKWKINGLEDLSWPVMIIVILVTLAVAFGVYAFLWWLITLLLGVSFAWNHALVFYIVCMAIGGSKSNLSFR